LFLVACALTGCWELPEVTSKADPALQPPIAKLLNFADGRSVDCIILGRSQKSLWVKDKRDPRNRVSLVRIRELTAPHQGVVRRIPIGVELATPFRAELTNAEGERLLVSVEARDASSVRFTNESEITGRTYIFPLANLSTDARELIEALPVTDLAAIREPSPILMARRRALVLAQDKLLRLQDEANKPALGGTDRFWQMRDQINAASDEAAKLLLEVRDLEEKERVTEKAARK
jgi:hypothetical protein